MAAISYFPSIHDSAMQNQAIWAHFDPEPARLSSPSTAPAAGSFNEGCTQEAEALAALTKHLKVPGYRPLEAFGTTAEGPGPAPWSDEDEIFEFLIRLKEIELLHMMGETFATPPYKFRRSFRYRPMQMRRKQK